MTTAAERPPLNPVNVTIFVGFPLAALILVPAWGIYRGYDAFQWLWALAFLYLNGLSITGGYHRLCVAVGRVGGEAARRQRGSRGWRQVTGSR